MTASADFHDALERFKAETHSPLRRDPYVDQPFPTPLDTAAQTMVDSFVDMPEAERVGCAAGTVLEISESQVLLAFAERMATQALREGSAACITAGLVACVLEGGQFDSRETLVVLTLLYDSAGRIGLEPAAVFQEVASLAHMMPIADSLRRFPDRKPQDLAIESMGYRTVMTRDGARYEADPGVWG